MNFSLSFDENTVSLKNGQTKTVLGLCLRCEPNETKECQFVLQQLKEEYEGEENIEKYLCLIKVELHVYSKMKKDKDTMIKYRVELSDFYNNVTKYGKGLSYLSSKLKGGAYAIFCMLLTKAMNEELITSNDTIIVKASGDLDDKDMSGLVAYYERLGFQQSDPENLEHHLYELEVPLHARVETILNYCNYRFDQGHISDELSDILRKFM